MIAGLIYAYLLGVMSILSPCTFVIIPVMTADINTRIHRVVSFLGGITVTFGLLGVLSALTGKLLTNFMGPYLYLLAGAVTLIAGLNMLNLINLRLPAINVKPKNNFLLGLVYGGVTLSCVGPLLASILVFTTTKANIFSGFIMMYVFSLGFITPFLLFGFLITDKKISAKLMRYTLKIRKVGGIMMLIVSAYLLFVALKGIL